MAYASELVGVGLPPGTAAGIGGQYKAVTATGSAQSDAAPLTASMSVVAGADGTKGVILVGQAGDEVWVFNNAASTLKVYPPTGAAISVAGTGLGTGNAAFSQLTYKATAYKCVTSTQWLAITSA
jgi:hypothetical protein